MHNAIPFWRHAFTVVAIVGLALPACSASSIDAPSEHEDGTSSNQHVDSEPAALTTSEARSTDDDDSSPKETYFDEFEQIRKKLIERRDDLKEDLKRAYATEPDRSDFKSEEEYRENLDKWNSHINAINSLINHVNEDLADLEIWKDIRVTFTVTLFGAEARVTLSLRTMENMYLSVKTTAQNTWSWLLQELIDRGPGATVWRSRPKPRLA